MELKLYFEIIYRRKWIIIFTLFATVLVALAVTLLMTPVYSATATVRVAGATTGNVETAELRYFDTLVNTYTTIAVSEPVLDELKQTLGIEQLSEIKIIVEAIPQTELISISAEATTPRMAQAVANSLAQLLIDRYQQLYIGGANSAQEILRDQLVQAEQELKQAQAEYEVLLAMPNNDEVQAGAVLRTLSFKERTYGMLLDRYEQVRLGEVIRTNAITIVEQASLPSNPAKPRPKANLLLAALVGGFGGIGLALLFDNLDTTIYSRKDIENWSKYPILAELPDWTGPTSLLPKRRTFLQNGSVAMEEAIRSLRMKLLAAFGTSPPRQILITSAEPREGKSTVVAKLAAAIAQTGVSVVIVDADLRAPVQHEIWNLSNEIGLTSVLIGEAKLDQALQETPIAEVRILTSGPVSPDASETLDIGEMAALEEKLRGKIDIAEIQVLTSGPVVSNGTDRLGSQEMNSLMAELDSRFDFVLIDSPSLLAVTDASILAQSVDSVIVLASIGMSKVEALAESLRRLEAVNAKVGGIVLNRGKQGKSYDGYYRNHQPTRQLMISGNKELELELEAESASHQVEDVTDSLEVIAGNFRSQETETRVEESSEIPIRELFLPGRLEAVLKQAGIITVENVLDRLDEGGDAALLTIDGFGSKGLAALKQALRANGHELAGTEQVAGANEIDSNAAPPDFEQGSKLRF